LVLIAAVFVQSIEGQQLIYQEGFNTDGETNVPPRYTTTGRDVYEVPRIQTELSNFDQKGPIYWAHNFDASYAGNPNIPARRMIFTWRGVDASAATPDLLSLFDSSVKWLLNGKTNARVVIQPNAAAVQGLADRLAASGHTVVDDDLAGTPDEQDVQGDLFIHGPGAGNASRFVLVTNPVIVMNAPDFDDMLTSSIGTSTSFEPGQVKIAAAGHPAAGGKTGAFNGLTGSQTFELVGRFLPTNATTLATIDHTVPPSVSRLSDVDDMIAGTKQNTNTSGTVTELDFADASVGSWPNDNPLPGGYTGNWGLRVKGKLSVSAAGTYRFAMGTDDGGRVQIDRDKNGFTAADTVLEDFGPHAFQIVYSDVTFTAAGTYDFEVRSYNSGGGGALEVSVANVAAPVPDDALDSGFWEVLGAAGATSPVKLQGAADVTGYIAAGPNVIVPEPLVVLLNGPNDTPPGAFYDGGRIFGFEGTGFFGASGLNKWAYPAGQTYRSLQLRPVDVAGKRNVKLTVALAATTVDFETSDFLNIVVYTNGVSGNPTTLANFHGVQDAVQPWMADQNENFVRRLTRQFADFTYDIPPSATQLVVEFRVATTWWTEIAAIDNVRITEGATQITTPQITGISQSGNNVTITWVNGGTLESAASLSAPITWTSTGDSDGSFTEAVSGNKYFRVRK
jgi:hypothetical protein